MIAAMNIIMREHTLRADYEATAVIRWLTGWAALFAAIACRWLALQRLTHRLAEYAGRTPAIR